MSWLDDKELSGVDTISLDSLKKCSVWKVKGQEFKSFLNIQNALLKSSYFDQSYWPRKSLQYLKRYLGSLVYMSQAWVKIIGALVMVDDTQSYIKIILFKI